MSEHLKSALLVGLREYLWSPLYDTLCKRNGRYYFVWFFTYAAVTVAILVFRQNRSSSRITLGAALKRCFPAEKVRAPSGLMDLKILVFNEWVIATALVAFIPTNAQIAKVTAKTISSIPFLHGIRLHVAHSWPLDLTYAFLLFFFTDFPQTLLHLAMHKVPWLWNFHKVHHAATDLNLFTTTREHPLEVLLLKLSSGVGFVITAGIFALLFGLEPSALTIAGVFWLNAVRRSVAFQRHADIWIDYGRRTSYFVASPYMHLIHHSLDPKHHNKNFCFTFAFWDWVLGTLYVAPEPERLEYGVSGREWGRRRYDTLWGNLVHPWIPERFLPERAVPAAEKGEASRSTT
jgi:sterol desaturase/sphingolipid hydroxylase (fatty acid hydroxylase superfamily)